MFDMLELFFNNETVKRMFDINIKQTNKLLLAMYYRFISSTFLIQNKSLHTGLRVIKNKASLNILITNKFNTTIRQILFT